MEEFEAALWAVELEAALLWWRQCTSLATELADRAVSWRLAFSASIDAFVDLLFDAEAAEREWADVREELAGDELSAGAAAALEAGRADALEAAGRAGAAAAQSRVSDSVREW